jgi:hypothetical protein
MPGPVNFVDNHVAGFLSVAFPRVAASVRAVAQAMARADLYGAQPSSNLLSAFADFFHLNHRVHVARYSPLWRFTALSTRDITDVTSEDIVDHALQPRFTTDPSSAASGWNWLITELEILHDVLGDQAFMQRVANHPRTRSEYVALASSVTPQQDWGSMAPSLTWVAVSEVDANGKHTAARFFDPIYEKSAPQTIIDAVADYIARGEEVKTPSFAYINRRQQWSPWLDTAGLLCAMAPPLSDFFPRR